MYVLLEKITVLPRFVVGKMPRWSCTNPIERFAIHVDTWRRINGSWIEGLLQRIEGTPNDDFAYNTMRCRLVVDDWPGLPRWIEFYDRIGEPEPQIDAATVIAEAEMDLMVSLRRK